MITQIPKAWNQAEINEYFNIRINTIEKFLPNLILNFEEVIPDEDTINASTVLRPATKLEMLNATSSIKDRIKPKKNEGVK